MAQVLTICYQFLPEYFLWGNREQKHPEMSFDSYSTIKLLRILKDFFI
jgi:hypothetical protein